MLQLNYRRPKVTFNRKGSQSAANLYVDFCLPVLATRTKTQNQKQYPRGISRAVCLFVCFLRQNGEQRLTPDEC